MKTLIDIKCNMGFSAAFRLLLEYQEGNSLIYVTKNHDQTEYIYFEDEYFEVNCESGDNNYLNFTISQKMNPKDLEVYIVDKIRVLVDIVDTKKPSPMLGDILRECLIRIEELK